MIPDFPRNIRIRLARLRNSFDASWHCIALSLPCWLSQLSWDSQQGRDIAMSGLRIQQIFYSYIMRKVWYHQIRIQKYLGFIVPHLTFMFLLSQFLEIWKNPASFLSNFSSAMLKSLWRPSEVAEIKNWMFYIKFNLAFD